MKLAGCLLALLGLLHIGLGLQVSLSEPNADHSSPLRLKDSPRTIPLVPGKTYSLLCDGTWRGPGESGVTQDGGNLTLQLFSEDMGGEYVCVDENEAEFVVIITAGNPVLIPSRVVVGLDKTIVRTDFPSLLVFGSGNPQPVPSNYSWYLNGQPFFLNGALVNTVEGHIRVRFNSIILEKDNIPASIEGTYVSVVNTSAGEMNVSITVRIEVKPSPVVSVLIPADYGEEYVANGESVTFNCSDTVAVPVPTFYWSFNGTRVTDSTPGFTISSGNEGRESYMTVAEVSLSDNRTEIKCEAHNTVEDEPMIGDASLSLTLRAPPPPPTNLTAGPLSGCRAELTWILPETPPTGSLVLGPEFYQIEGRAGGPGGQWVVLSSDISNDTNSTAVDVRDTAGMNNVEYHFRISSGNKRGGVSTESSTETTEPIQLFFDPLPMVSMVTVTPVPSPRPSLRVSWTNPSSDCYTFSSHTITCSPRHGDTPPSNTTSVPGPTSSADVTLGADSAYFCFVNSTIADRAGGEFPTMTSSDKVNGFTYPNPPEIPGQPRPVSSAPDGTFPSSNITVAFSLPSDHNATISHYQVLVVRVRSEEDLPATHPDIDYPAGTNFSSERDVNDPTRDSPLLGPYIAVEITAERFNSVFTIGGGAADPDSPYKNGPLLSGTKYSCFLRAFPRSSAPLGRGRRQSEGGGRQYVVFSSSPYMQPVQETASSGDSDGSTNRITPTVVAVITVGVVAALLLMAAALTLFVCCCLQRRRRRYHIGTHSAAVSSSSKGSLVELPPLSTPELCRREAPEELKTFDFLEEDSELIPSDVFPVNLFREHVEKFDENRQLFFQLEFDWVQRNAPKSSAEASSLPVNDDKNRYSNIKAFDHSRVVLSSVVNVEGSDYINANYIPGFKRTKEYISTQGPLEQTVSEFWRMVWEQNSATIVMLTNLVEVGKVKCEQYWPSAAVGSITYGNTDVRLDNVVELRDYIIRNFTITHVPTNETHSVLQFHYTKWPDYGTPKLAAPLLNFLRAVHSANPPDVGPIVVHCSAGVGRSGTVICIDYCLAQLRADSVIDVRGFVSKMREHRNYMVQTETQYAFIHYAILESMTYGNTSFSVSDFPPSYKQLQQETRETGRTMLEEEYRRLGTVKTMSKASTFIQRVKQKGPTNRSIHYPGHASYSEGFNPHEYNAHYVDSYFTPKLFVVADGPEERNANKFWQMVWDQDCSYLIMLSPIDTQYFSYWPTKKGEHETYGNIKVTIEDETAEHYYTTRVISISNAKIGISQKVTQYQFVGWMMQDLPPVPTFVSFVCDILREIETLQRNQRALIHDMKSMGPSGIFCSLCFCIERLREERMVDVFQTVQTMQLQRPGTVHSMKEYVFIYDCVYEYIRTHLSM